MLLSKAFGILAVVQEAAVVRDLERHAAIAVKAAAEWEEEERWEEDAAWVMTLAPLFNSANHALHYSDKQHTTGGQYGEPTRYSGLDSTYLFWKGMWEDAQSRVAAAAGGSRDAPGGRAAAAANGSVRQEAPPAATHGRRGGGRSTRGVLPGRYTA